VANAIYFTYQDTAWKTWGRWSIGACGASATWDSVSTMRSLDHSTPPLQR
jgi:hypothetical protein